MRKALVLRIIVSWYMEKKEIDEKEMQERLQLSMLYDFYGALLKKNQQDMFEAYVLEDYSISEIADEMGITRQGVHDAIKRASRQLRDYEEKLALVEKFQKQKEAIQELHELLKKQKIAEDSVEWKRIFEILEETE